MFDKTSLGFKYNDSPIAFFERGFAKECHQITRYPVILFTAASIEWGGLKQVHKDVIARILGAYKSLPHGWIDLHCKGMDLTIPLFQLRGPVKSPFQLPKCKLILLTQSQDVRFKNFSGANILDRVRKLINLEIKPSAFRHV